jgi:hypothetical protein
VRLNLATDREQFVNQRHVTFPIGSTGKGWGLGDYSGADRSVSDHDGKGEPWSIGRCDGTARPAALLAMVRNLKWLGKFVAALREFGFASGCVYVMDRGLRYVGTGLYLYRFVAQPVRTAPLLPGARGRTIVVRKIGLDEPALAGMPLTRAVIEYRARQNALCLGAFKDEQMIGYLWLCLGPYQEDEVRCRFVPAPGGRASWDFDVYVLPEHRAGLAFLRLWDEANRLLRDAGFAWSISRISALNPHSLASHAKLGAQRCGSALFVRIGAAQLTFTSLYPYLGFSYGAKWAPEIVVHAPAASW